MSADPAAQAPSATPKALDDDDFSDFSDTPFEDDGRVLNDDEIDEWATLDSPTAPSSGDKGVLTATSGSEASGYGAASDLKSTNAASKHNVAAPGVPQQVGAIGSIPEEPAHTSEPVKKNLKTAAPASTSPAKWDTISLSPRAPAEAAHEPQIGNPSTGHSASAAALQSDVAPEVQKQENIQTPKEAIVALLANSSQQQPAANEANSFQSSVAQGHAPPAKEIAPATDDSEAAAMDSQQQDEEAQQPSNASWGWGGSWGFQAISGRLKQVAAGAVRDVRELTDSLQQALGEVEGTTDEEDSELDSSSHAQPSPSRFREAANPGGAADPEAVSGTATAATAGAAAPHQAPAAQELASRDEISEAEDGEDAQLHTGLKAIDDQVEQLASGAAKALSSLWGGLSGVTKVGQVLVSKVEAATNRLAQDLSAGVSEDVQQLQEAASSGFKGAAGSVSKLGMKLEKGLENVGRTAFSLIGEVAGQYIPSAVAGPGSSASEPSTFEDFFYLYGGQQLCEDLQALANDCARTCNKSRSKLDSEQQEQLDAKMAQLGTLFENQPQNQQAEALDQEGLEASEQLQQKYAPVAYLLDDSLSRAAAFKDILQRLAKEGPSGSSTGGGGGSTIPSTAPENLGEAPSPDAIQPAATSQSDGAASQEGPGADTQGTADMQQQQQQPASDEAQSHPQAAQGPSPSEGAEEPSKQAPADSSEDGVAGEEPSPIVAALSNVRAHSAKRMAELCTAQIQLLFNYGASIAAPGRAARMPNDGLSWPQQASAQVLLLQQQLQRMVADIQSVCEAYCGAASVVMQPAAFANSVPEDEQQALAAVASSLVHELQAAGGSAVTRVQEGYRGLLSTVLLRYLVVELH